MITVQSTTQLKKQLCYGMSLLLYCKQQLDLAKKSGKDLAKWQERVEQTTKRVEELSTKLKWQEIFKKRKLEQQKAKQDQANQNLTGDNDSCYYLLSIQRKAILEELNFYKAKLQEYDQIIRMSDNSKLQDLGNGRYFFMPTSIELEEYQNCLKQIKKCEKILAHSIPIDPRVEHDSIQVGTYFLTTKKPGNYSTLSEDVRSYLLLDEVNLPNLKSQSDFNILTKKSLMGNMAIGRKIGDEVNGETVLYLQNAESMKYPVLKLMKNR